MMQLLWCVLTTSVLSGIVGELPRPDEPATPPQALPAGAVARFGTSRFLNFGRAFSVAFAPDGKTLAVGSWDGSVRLWEVGSGKELHVFQDQTSPVRAVAFSPDGKILACGNEGVGIVLRATATGKELQRLKGHRGSITGLEFSPDGKLLASKAYDQTFRLWDVAEGREVRRFGRNDAPKQEHDAEFPMAFALDGKTIASAMYDARSFDGPAQRKFRVWELATGTEVRSIPLGKSRYGPIALSPAGKLLAVAVSPLTGQRPRIDLWDMDTGKALRPIEPPQADDLRALACLTFSPDGRTLAASGGGPVQLWEVATRSEVARFPAQDTGPSCLVFSPDGRLLVSGSTDITVLLWDVTGRLRQGQLPPTTLTPSDSQTCWEELGGPEAAPARRALWKLVAGGNASVVFLRTHLQPVTSPASAEAITRLITDLDSADFDVRSKARAQLLQLAELAEPALLEAQGAQPSLELRQRIGELLKVIVDLRSRPAGERLRAYRAVEVLEQIATPEARQLLVALARGAAGGSLTRAAQASLARLERRTGSASPSP